MKKRTIWTIAVVMGFSFLALLFLQLKYMDAMIKMKKEQLDESVNKALYQAARNLELNETLRYLERDVNETERRAYKNDSVGTRTGMPDGTVQHSHQYAVTDKNGNVYSSFELKTLTIKPSSMPKAMILSPPRRGGIQYIIYSLRQTSEGKGQLQAPGSGPEDRADEQRCEHAIPFHGFHTGRKRTIPLSGLQRRR